MDSAETGHVKEQQNCGPSQKIIITQASSLPCESAAVTVPHLAAVHRVKNSEGTRLKGALFAKARGGAATGIRVDDVIAHTKSYRLLVTETSAELTRPGLISLES